MREIETGSFAPEPLSFDRSGSVRVISWNINRGLRLAEVIDFLRGSAADLILLQETDLYARRTGGRNIAREIARALRMNYVFGREFEELAQGTRSAPAYHGQTTLSRFLLSRPCILSFRRQSGFWRPRPFIPALPWMQRRIGGRMALVCEVAAEPGRLITYNLHLESRGNHALRTAQLAEVLEDAGRVVPKTPLLIAGDFNLDLASGPAASLANRCGFINPFVVLGGRRTVTAPRRGRDGCIDWMLMTQDLRVNHATIHDSISASDHYPISIQLGWSS